MARQYPSPSNLLTYMNLSQPKMELENCILLNQRLSSHGCWVLGVVISGARPHPHPTMHTGGPILGTLGHRPILTAILRVVQDFRDWSISNSEISDHIVIFRFVKKNDLFNSISFDQHLGQHLTVTFQHWETLSITRLEAKNLY